VSPGHFSCLYYGALGLKELYPLLQRINYYLVHWLRKKYRRLASGDVVLADGVAAAMPSRCRTKAG
jgi:hypothetical protein